jgi:DNA-binding MarR family transcriptional regulator
MNAQLENQPDNMPPPIRRKAALTDGLTPEIHISFLVAIVSNLMAFGNVPENIRRFGLTVRQWRIISLLGEMGPMTLSDITNTVHHDKSSLSRSVRDLEKRGLVGRVQNNRHKSSPFIWFTNDGAALYEKISPQFAHQAEALTEVLSAGEKQQLCALLDKLHGHMENQRVAESWGEA